MRIVSYNILAPSYVRPDWYPFTDRGLLTWEARRERIVRRLLDFEADLLCLQEVEPSVFDYLQTALKPANFSGVYAQKHLNRPDGCATFVQIERVSFDDSHALYYHDGVDSEDSGHVALFTRVRANDRVVTVANSHIRWDKHEHRNSDHIGFRQASELIAACRTDGHFGPRVLCGDFNAEPESDLVRVLTEEGFRDAYAAAPQPTCNSNRRVKRIDYILHTRELTAAPRVLPQIRSETPLPSESEPSDHLPIAADMALNSAASDLAPLEESQS